MKKIFLAILLFVSLHSVAQSDSTKIKGLSLTSSLIKYIIVNCMNTANDSLFQVYIDLRAKYRIPNPPQGATLVPIDSIPTVELANLYNYCLGNPDGMSMANAMKNQIAATRTANTYLDQLCISYETFWRSRLVNIIMAGGAILKGK